MICGNRLELFWPIRLSSGGATQHACCPWVNCVGVPLARLLAVARRAGVVAVPGREREAARVLAAGRERSAGPRATAAAGRCCRGCRSRGWSRTTASRHRPGELPQVVAGAAERGRLGAPSPVAPSEMKSEISCWCSDSQVEDRVELLEERTERREQRRRAVEHVADRRQAGLRGRDQRPEVLEQRVQVRRQDPDRGQRRPEVARDRLQLRRPAGWCSPRTSAGRAAVSFVSFRNVGKTWNVCDDRVVVGGGRRERRLGGRDQVAQRRLVVADRGEHGAAVADQVRDRGVLDVEHLQQVGRVGRERAAGCRTRS